jgi:hypothetical protein
MMACLFKPICAGMEWKGKSNVNMNHCNDFYFASRTGSDQVLAILFFCFATQRISFLRSGLRKYLRKCPGGYLFSIVNINMEGDKMTSTEFHRWDFMAVQN